MKNTIKTVKPGSKIFIATVYECGDEEDLPETISLGAFSTKAQAVAAVEKDAEKYLTEWNEATGGEAYREMTDGGMEVNSGDDRYIRRYSISSCKFLG